MKYAALVSLISISFAFAQSAPPLPTGSFVVEHVRIFDGEKFVEDVSVQVRDGKILGLNEASNGAEGVPRIDGQGLTLLPGLIDAHTHVYASALRQALAFGITTEFDMFSAISTSMKIKEAQEKGEWKDAADLFTAGTLVTAPGGHGTEYGMKIPTIAANHEAQAFVDARLAEGSDYIKIVYDSGQAVGRTIPTIDKATLRALVLATHARQKLAVVHVMSLKEATEAITCRADGLAHLFIDQPGDAAFAQNVKRHHAFVIPTLSVLQSLSGRAAGRTLADDPKIKPFVGPNELANLRRNFGHIPEKLDYHVAEQTIAELRAVGVPILAGTDSPNPGTAHGASLHGELELLVAAGLTPEEALAGATALAAEQFKIYDRGRIAAGYRADLLLVRGNPAEDIRVTREIVGIWKAGIPFDRDAYRKEIEVAQAQAQESAKQPPNLGEGQIADFDTGELTARFGGGWSSSTDAIAGGKSTVELKVVGGGAEESSHALSIAGTIDPAVNYAWAGALFWPGPQPFQPVDLSAMQAIDFWAKGDGKTYRVMAFTRERGTMPLTATFVASENWTHVTIPFANFEGTSGKNITGFLFSGGPAPEGPFQLMIDNVKLVK